MKAIHKVPVFKSAQTFGGIVCTIEASQATLDELGMTVDEFFAKAKSYAALHAKTFHNLYAEVKVPDA